MEPLPALIEHFQDLDDPRIERCKLHKLIDIVFIAICAVVAGAEGWKDIEAFAHAKEPWLGKYLELPNGLPSDDTFRRVIARLKPTQFEGCFRRWIDAVVEQSQGDLINIDGKTLRGSYDRRDERAATSAPRSTWSMPGPRRIGCCWPNARSPTRVMRSLPFRSCSMCSISAVRS